MDPIFVIVFRVPSIGVSFFLNELFYKTQFKLHETPVLPHPTLPEKSFKHFFGLCSISLD